LFDLNLDKLELLKIAHIIEVELATGLGDVIAQGSKGIVIRNKPGFEGINSISNILEEDLYVITKTIGEIDTKSVIKNTEMAEKINKLGINATKDLLKNKTTDSLMKLSYDFAKNSSLINNELMAIIKEMNKNSLGSSMAMLGNTAFALSNNIDEDLDNINLDNLLVSQVDNIGIRFI
jgi:pantoate kinase